jgi:hypothetical protein
MNYDILLKPKCQKINYFGLLSKTALKNTEKYRKEIKMTDLKKKLKNREFVNSAGTDWSHIAAGSKKVFQHLEELSH